MIKQRQAMTVTPKQLHELADELETDFIDAMQKEHIKHDVSELETKKFQVNIVNESDCSDTWRCAFRSGAGSIDKRCSWRWRVPTPVMAAR